MGKKLQDGGEGLGQGGFPGFPQLVGNDGLQFPGQ